MFVINKTLVIISSIYSLISMTVIITIHTRRCSCHLLCSTDEIIMDNGDIMIKTGVTHGDIMT